MAESPQLEIVLCTSNEERCFANLRLMLSHCVTEPAVTIIGDQCELESSEWESFGDKLLLWGSAYRRGPVASLQRGYELSTAPIIAFIHDDVEIYERAWDLAVLEEFQRPGVGVVGFGGAIGLGTDDIYQTPYRLQQLARLNYGSNAPDWQTHGHRFTGSREVATLDGYCLIVNRELLDKIGGWPVKHLMFHNYDNAICLYARRHGYKVRQLGIYAKHAGGGTSVKDGRYAEWLQREFGKTDSNVHWESHDWLYAEFKDVLPVRI